MKRNRKIILAGVVVTLAAVGTGIGFAASGDDKSLQGKTLERASEAALDHLGEGTVVDSESGDDGATYEVEVRRDDGSVVEIGLDENFDVLTTERDDDDGSEDEAGEQEADDD